MNSATHGCFIVIEACVECEFFEDFAATAINVPKGAARRVLEHFIRTRPESDPWNTKESNLELTWKMLEKSIMKFTFTSDDEVTF